MRDDTWFRNETWNPEIEEQFRTHLKRARQKSQYLHIQASTLVTTHPRVALTLLEEYFATKDELFLAQAYINQARAYLAIRNLEAALSALESTLAREREFPNVRTQAYLLLPCLIAEQQLSQRYPQALDILDAHRSWPTFPVEHYQWHGARALILSDQGAKAEASQEARNALEAAQQDKSGFRHHPDIGLVKDISEAFGIRLKHVARATG